MNSNRYRVVFNQVRGQLMAVAETAAGRGKGRRGTRASESVRPNCLMRFTPIALALWLVTGSLPSAWAQIIANPTAPAGQRPTVLLDSTGRPLVNIQTPSAGGVSRNTYQQFDVQGHGIVLNNQRTSNPWLATGEAKVILNEVNSSNPSYLGGAITVNGATAQVVIANPSGIKIDGASFVNASRATLTTGTPVISNGQLTGLNVTQGTVEITGKGLSAVGTAYTDILSRAASIAARVDANELNITTGTQTIDYASGQLTATTGTGIKPTVAIDTAALGGMYAGKISLLATEAGVGVRNAGTLQTTAANGQLIITADGRLENTGFMSSAVTSLATVTGNIDNSGALIGSNLLMASSGADANLQGSGMGYVLTQPSTVLVHAQRDVNLAVGATVSSNGVGGQVAISAGRNINLAAGSNVNAHGNVQLSSEGLITATNASVGSLTADVTALATTGMALTNTTATGQRVHLETGAPFQQTSSNIAITNGRVNGTQQTAVIASGDIWISSNPGTTTVSSGGNVYLEAARNLSFAAGSTATAGANFTATAGEALQLQATSGTTATNGSKVSINATGDVRLSGGSTFLYGSRVTAGGAMAIEAQKTDALLYALPNAGQAAHDRVQLRAGQDLTISAYQRDIFARALDASAQNIHVVSNGVTSIGHVMNTVGSSKTALGSILAARTDLTVASISADKPVQVIGSILSAGGVANIIGNQNILLYSANNEKTTNSILAYTSVRPNISAASVNVQGGNIYTQGANIAAYAGHINLSAIKGDTWLNSHNGNRTVLKAGGNIAVHADKTFTHSDTFASAGGSMATTSANGSISSTGAVLVAADVLSLSSKGAQSHVNGFYDGGALSVYNQSGTLAFTNTRLQTRATQSTAVAALSGQLSIESGAGISVDSKTNFAASTDLSIVAGSGDFTVTPPGVTGATTGLVLSQAQFQFGRDLSLGAKTGNLRLIGSSGSAGNPSSSVVSLTAQRDLMLSGASVELQAARLTSARDTAITSYNGKVSIDGIKNSFSAYTPVQKITALQSKINELNSAIAALNSDPAHVDLKTQYNLLGVDYQYQCLMQDRANETPCTDLVDQLTQLYTSLKYYDDRRVAIVSDKAEIELIQTTLNAPARGTENLGASISGRNISITSAAGLSVNGAQITASDKVGLYSAGVLPIDITASTAELQKPVGISLTGLSDFYEYGAAGTSSHAWALMSRPTEISAVNGVTIHAMGNTADARLVLNDTAIRSSAGTIRLESLGDMRLESGQQEFYKYTSRTYETGDFLFSNTITETSTTQRTNASPVRLAGTGIVLKSGGSIDAYATDFAAPAGTIGITAANALGLYAVPQVTFDQFDATKRSAFIGINYSKDTSTTSRQVSAQLPSVLVAERASTASGWDTRLQGTIFQTSLGGAQIAAGVGPNARADAQIILEGIKKTVTERSTRESNYVLWQRQAGAGGTIETLTLPSFTGPSQPTFTAPGGLSVQIPTGDFKTQIESLSQQPDMAYLQTLATRTDVNWQPVKLAYDQWSYDQQGLTPAGAALLSVAVAWATGGMGAGLVGATTGSTSALMANAAFTSLASQASITLINNKGDIGKTLKDLGRSSTVKATVAAALTAGALAQISTLPGMQTLATSTEFTDKLTANLINAGGRALTNTAINGGSLEDALKGAMIGGLVDTLHGQVASKIALQGYDYLSHKLAHALAGCVAGAAAQGTCQDGAIGAAVGEVVAQLMPPANGMFYTDAEKPRVLAYSKLIAGGVSAYSGGNGQTAITTAETAVTNNAFFIPPLIYLLAAGASAYTTGVGDGNPVEGLKTIGQGKDPLSQVLVNGTQAAVSLSMQAWPKETTATLNFLAAAGQAVDATVSYVDSATGKVVSTNWNSLSVDARNALIGAGKVTGVVLSPVGVGQLKTLVTNAPKAVSEQTKTLAMQGMIRQAGEIDPLTGKPILDLNTLAKQPNGLTGLKEATGDLFGSATMQTLFTEARYVGGAKLGEKGLDAVYKVNSKDVDYLFVEYKYNTSRQGSTADGLQGSLSWVTGSDRIDKAVGRELSPAVYQAARTGRTETLLIQTLPDGRTNVKLLDVNGKSIPITQSRLELVQRVANNLNLGILP